MPSAWADSIWPTYYVSSRTTVFTFGIGSQRVRLELGSEDSMKFAAVASTLEGAYVWVRWDASGMVNQVSPVIIKS